jgi:hypothetical protein
MKTRPASEVPSKCPRTDDEGSDEISRLVEKVVNSYSAPAYFDLPPEIIPKDLPLRTAFSNNPNSSRGKIRSLNIFLYILFLRAILLIGLMILRPQIQVAFMGLFFPENVILPILGFKIGFRRPLPSQAFFRARAHHPESRRRPRPRLQVKSRFRALKRVWVLKIPQRLQDRLRVPGLHMSPKFPSNPWETFS